MDRQDAYCETCLDEGNGAIRLCLLHAAVPALVTALEGSKKLLDAIAAHYLDIALDTRVDKVRDQIRASLKLAMGRPI